jgi:hypothetical protein
LCYASSSFNQHEEEHFMKMKSLSLLLIAIGLVGCASNQVAKTSTQGARTEVCKATTEAEIESLFDRWNQSLQTGDSHKVAANYAERSILLPTFSNKPRLTSTTSWRTAPLARLT